VLERVLALAPAATPNGRTVIVTSVTGDAHSFGAEMIAAYFELDGWRSICLGADMPIDDLVSIAIRFDAHLVAIGATLDTQRASVARTIATLRAARPAQRVLVGGAAFAFDAALWRRVGADAYAESPMQAIEVAGRLVSD
jgi:methanogenic corrinoid protein MtbC1